MSYNQWTSMKLSNIGDIVTGKTPPTKDEKYWGGTIPFLTPTDNMDQKNITETIRFLSKKASEDFPKLYLPIDSICVSCIGSDLGKVVKVKRRLITNQQINSIIPKPSYHPDFIYYSMIILGKKMNHLSKTSTAVPIINKSTFSNFDILVPNYNIQKAIANILSSLDDKIELNNKINKNLEEVAQTLYKRWFVEFEFPNEDGEPYKSSGGEMVESELGLIPKEWYVDLLGNVVNIIYGKNLPTKNLLLKGYPVFGGNGIIGYNDKFLYKNPKVLVSCRGAASGSVLNSLKNSFVTNNSLILEDNEKISYEYLKELSKNRSYFDFVSGSAQPQVTIASISQCKIIIPQRKTLNEFTKVMKESNEIIENLYYENLKLAQLRDELLPKLMSGEIEVAIEE